MSEVLVNAQAIEPETGPKTWSELLTAVEARAAAQGEVVTAVRFGGVDQPSFRPSGFDDRPVASLGRVEIDTMPRARLLSLTLGTAGRSLPDVAAGACQAAGAFRRGDEVEGHRQLSVLLATIRTLVELALASATAAGTDLAELSCGDESASAVLGAAGVVLDSLAQQQRAEDWVALADGLEYDLAPAILQWGAVFEAMQERCAV